MIRLPQGRHILMLTLVLGQATSIFSAETTETRISSLVAQPRSFDKKMVKVTAYVHAGRHFTMLLERKSSDLGVALIIPEKVRGDASVDALMDEIYVLPQQSTKHWIRGTFTGVFEWHPGSVPSRVLSLRDITNLEREKMHD